MHGYVVEHIQKPNLALTVNPAGERIGKKLVWRDRHGALRFARLEDAMAFGETFAPGSFRVMPVTPAEPLKPVAEEPPAELRVLDADPAEGALSEIEIRPAPTKPKAPPTRLVTEGAKPSAKG